MEKYKTITVTSVLTGKKYEKQVMTKEYALSLQHSKRGQLNRVQRIAAIRASHRRKFVKAFREEFPNKEIPQALPQRLGGYKN